MSTKVEKVSKTSTKSVPAKAVSKVITKTEKSEKITKSPTIRLSEEDKKADTDNYILNTNTDKYVKRDTPLGKKLVIAEQTGQEIPKTITETDRLILVVQTLKDQLELKDSAIKVSLKSISGELPRGFPVVWGGKQKTVRSPDHPNHPNNAYIFYTKAIRQSVSEANPELSNTEIVSMMAKMWKDTVEVDRKEYNELAAEDKERYEAEMKIFEAEHPDQARAKSSPGKPTKVTAYHKYCEENRETLKADNPDLDGKAINKLLAEKWDEIKKDKNEVNKYQELADDVNKGFEDRIVEYHENNSPKKLSEAEQNKSNNPDKYELNSKTGRYVEKAKPKPKKEASPEPELEQESKPVASKSVSSKAKAKANKTISENITNDKVEVESNDNDNDDLLV